MTSQLYLARGIAAGMIHSDQDPALVRSAEIAARGGPPRAPRPAHRPLTLAVLTARVVWHAGDHDLRGPAAHR